MQITLPSRDVLITKLKEKMSYLNSEIEAWDFPCEEGKTYEVLTHDFRHNWTMEEARKWQLSQKADGNVAAFFTWVLQEDPKGWFTSIPNDDARLFRRSDGVLYAPNFDRDVDRREFRLRHVWISWDGGRSLVAFSAISSDPVRSVSEPLPFVLRSPEEKELWKSLVIGGHGIKDADELVLVYRERIKKEKK